MRAPPLYILRKLSLEKAGNIEDIFVVTGASRPEFLGTLAL